MPEGRWVIKEKVDKMIMDFMTLTPTITKTKVKTLVDEIFDVIDKENR